MVKSFSAGHIGFGLGEDGLCTISYINDSRNLYHDDVF